MKRLLVVAEAQKKAIELARMLVRCEEMLQKHLMDMEDAKITDEPIYAETHQLERDVGALLFEVSK